MPPLEDVLNQLSLLAVKIVGLYKCKICEGPSALNH
jgi:hypothetical protein